MCLPLLSLINHLRWILFTLLLGNDSKGLKEENPQTSKGNKTKNIAFFYWPTLQWCSRFVLSPAKKIDQISAAYSPPVPNILSVLWVEMFLGNYLLGWYGRRLMLQRLKFILRTGKYISANGCFDKYDKNRFGSNSYWGQENISVPMRNWVNI